MRAAAANPSLRPAALAQIDSLQAATADADRQELPRRRRAGDLPGDRQPAGHLDVDRRPDRPGRGADRALAGPRAAAAAPSSDTELEALKEAKYREIRDAELDHAAGKLSDEDFALLDAELRKEAVEILDRGNGNGSGATPAEPRLDLQQHQGVDDEEDREEDRRPIQVALDHRAAAEGAAAAADAEGAGEARRLCPSAAGSGRSGLPEMITWMTAKKRVHGGGVSQVAELAAHRSLEPSWTDSTLTVALVDKLR